MASPNFPYHGSRRLDSDLDLVPVTEFRRLLRWCEDSRAYERILSDPAWASPADYDELRSRLRETGLPVSSLYPNEALEDLAWLIQRRAVELR